MSANIGIKKLLSLGAISAAMAISSQVSAGTIIGSAHDFNTANANGSAWDTQICLACHTPHNAQAGAQQIAPLWGHDTTAATFTLYTGVANSGVLPGTTSLNAVVGQPTGTSLLCLSCHDGTVAVDSFGGKANGGGLTRIGTLRLTADLGTDLSNDHPISFLYDANLATQDGSLWGPTDVAHQITTLASPNGGVRTGTIDEVLLENSKMECSSCHDVHNTFTGAEPMLLKISITGSQLCLSCHNK
ncbi:MAG: cytochrome c3 family protein [Gammaproteobacteria bacterium]